MSEELQSILIGTAGLGMAGVVALFALLAQLLHFGEEFGAGFHERFPQMLGLSAWSPRFFVSFNLFWLSVWGLCTFRLFARRPIGPFTLGPLWFLGIAGTLNGVAHPVLTLLARGYFPGLFTSFFAGFAGPLLVRSLFRLTAPAGRPLRQ